MIKLFSSLFIVLLFLGATTTQAKQKKKTKGKKPKSELYYTIAQQDSLLFDAYNKRDLTTMKKFFTKDLEWFQDNEGVLNFEKVFSNFDQIFHRDYVLTRSLNKKSLDVYPIKDYGAIEVGKHSFTHMENGKEVKGSFKFVMVWKLEQGEWKISRVISFDH